MLRIDQPLFAFGPFTSGAMLLWGLAAVVPIVLHLLNQRRRHTITFAAMQFLLAAQRQQTRRMRFWQWLLLLARVAAVLLIAAALANPIFGDRRPEAQRGSDPALHVLVLDASYSMQAASDDGEAVWDHAVGEALMYVDRAAAGDAFCLVRMADPVVSLIPRPVRDAQAVRRELQRMQPTAGTASLPQTLAVVQQLVDDVRQPQEPPFEDAPFDGLPFDGVQVVIFSDMQRGTWSRLVQSDGRQAWDALAAEAAIRVIPVDLQDRTQANITVGTMQVTSGMIAAGQVVQVQAEVRRSDTSDDAGDQAGGQTGEGGLADDTVIQLKSDGQIRASTPLSQLETRRAATVTLSTRLAAGENALELATDDDVLAVDNRQWIPLAVPAELRVVCIGAERDTRYVAAAVAPRRDGPVQVRAVTPDQIQALRVAEIDVLMLCDLREPTQDLVTLLDQAAQAGVGVVWWLGESVDAAAYRRAAQLGSAALLPMLPTRIADASVYAVDPRAYEHPIVAPFEPHPQSGLLSTPIFRYWIMAPGGESGLSDTPSGYDVALAAGERGDPLLLTHETATHRIAIFTSAPSDGGGASSRAADSSADGAPWNALIAWPSFVPLVQETLRWVIAARWQRPSMLVGQPMTGMLLKSLGRPTQVTIPGGSQQTVNETQDAGNHWRWSAGIATQPGVYRLHTDGGHIRLFVVNVDPREGDLSRFTAGVPESTPTDDGNGADRAATGDRREAAAPWFRALLAIGMGLLAIESLISRVVLGWERSP